MLSGIGPREELERHGIAVRVDLPGVGRNLQDRYEVGVVNRMNFDHWEVLKGATFARDDPQYRAVGEPTARASTRPTARCSASSSARARAAAPGPLLLRAPGALRGLLPRLLAAARREPQLPHVGDPQGAHQQPAGEVTLRSADPRDTPDINFHYFDEGSDAAGEDLDAVVDGVKFVRRLTGASRKDAA